MAWDSIVEYHDSRFAASELLFNFDFVMFFTIICKLMKVSDTILI